MDQINITKKRLDYYMARICDGEFLIEEYVENVKTGRHKEIHLKWKLQYTLSIILVKILIQL
jgi:hypothetical protein